MDKQTLEEAFRELIKQRKWYINSLRSPVQAKNDKATFLKGGKKEETNEDRRKRKEEEAEIERLYKEMLIQQNAPVKKNPLTKLIEAL